VSQCGRASLLPGPRHGWACNHVYEVITDEQSQPQIDALPADALEARAALELAPWNGEPYHGHRPDSPIMR
jgi:hypothetical protein